MSSSIRRWCALVFLVATALGCGATASPTPSGATATAGSPVASTAPPPESVATPSGTGTATASLPQPNHGGSAGAADICSYLPAEVVEELFGEPFTQRVLRPVECHYVTASEEQRVALVITPGREGFEKSRVFVPAEPIAGLGEEALWLPDPRVVSVFTGSQSVRLHFILPPERSTGFPDRAVEMARVVLAALP